MLQGRQSDTAGELLHGKDSALDSDQRPHGLAVDPEGHDWLASDGSMS